MKDERHLEAKGNSKPISFYPTPENCEVCGVKFPTDTGVIMVDGDTNGTGSPWACMCNTCFNFGNGSGLLGAGYGQKYKRREDGLFWLVEGGI